jgi:hypothetical protein
VRQLEISATGKPGLSALNADAEAAGELKDVAAKVFPETARKDPEKARNKLSDALRPNHAQKLEIDEAIEIIVEAVAKSHRSSLVEHILSRLPKDSFEFRWLTKEEKMERVTATLSQMLPQFVDVLQRAQALVNGERK